MHIILSFICTFFIFSSGFAQNKTQTISNLKAIIFDMDGVLRRGFTPLDGSSELINWMNESGMPGMILTNECRYATHTIRHDLNRMGIKIPSSWPIYTSAMAVRDFLETRVYSEGDLFVYVVGEAGLKAAVSQVKRERFHFCSDLPPLRSPEDELIVVFGAVDQIQISDLEQASNWINAGAKVITSCPDVSDPSAKGSKLIGMPSHMVHMIKMHAPCIPYCVGKPHTFTMAKALELVEEMVPGIKKEEILFVGDSLDTDIRIAFEAGMPSALVLTGNTREESLQNHLIRPNFVFPSVKHLYLELSEESYKNISMCAE